MQTLEADPLVPSGVLVPLAAVKQFTEHTDHSVDTRVKHQGPSMSWLSSNKTSVPPPTVEKGWQQGLKEDWKR